GLQGPQIRHRSQAVQRLTPGRPALQAGDFVALPAARRFGGRGRAPGGAEAPPPHEGWIGSRPFFGVTVAAGLQTTPGRPASRPALPHVPHNPVALSSRFRHSCRRLAAPQSALCAAVPAVLLNIPPVVSPPDRTSRFWYA